MDTFWWVALAAVVLLALVAAVVDGRGRSDRGPRSRRPRQPVGSARPPSRPSGPDARGGGREEGRTPRAGEVWWADVPYEDGPGSKDRPCLVISVRGRGRGRTALVAKITSKHHEERPGVIALPRGPAPQSPEGLERCPQAPDGLGLRGRAGGCARPG
ncbi:type II toxin-antitoxin system PemK/MazF family toxin [Streptomyces sp. ID01-9D]|uniref:type II toxin-antitoxin system PemK/MazF family toxin n=1 Tax=Streptomyces sp. ID01-9D TaxID=3028659 RepID=UPI0029C34545|nr:type II toxin-antitoxin system PemK/MazF family toxin [Streptomyces sp. ID01-9D]MDX5575485.1 type II toxin-antitoxin system PemK/MazF family toxin [Streptomyces sp. ID01-9D]